MNAQYACEARTDKHLSSSRNRPLDTQRIKGKELSLANQLVAILPPIEPVRIEVRVQLHVTLHFNSHRDHIVLPIP